MGIGKSVSAVNTPLLHPLSALSVIPSSSTKMVKSQSRKSSVSSPSPVLDGRVRKAAVSEQVEMQLYLSKLKELVPNMPKDRKVSKVEVINNVIDYICDLQMALDVHHHAAPSVSCSTTTTAAAATTIIIITIIMSLSTPLQPVNLFASFPRRPTLSQTPALKR